MADRSTDSLDHMPAERDEAPEATPPVRAKAVPVVASVELNYPDPTPLATIVRDVARWSGHSFVMEPSLNVKLQIFSPRRMTPAEAYEVFLASLTVVNLRAVQIGRVVKLVPVTIAVSA